MDKKMAKAEKLSNRLEYDKTRLAAEKNDAI